MALEATVTKKSASKGATGIYSISMNLVLTDDTVEVINQDFAQVHNSANNISVARDEIMTKMQDAIDEYKENKVVYDSAAFTNAVTYINTNLVV